MPDREALKPKLEDFTEPIWEQQKGETALWFGRFCRYRNLIGVRSVITAWMDERTEAEEMGDRRSLQKRKKVTKSDRPPNSWYEASRDWRWKERAEAHDRHILEAKNRVWLKRQESFREQRWKWYEVLTAKAQPMMEMPIVKQTLADGDRIVQISATKWSQFRYAIALIETADRLGAGAIGDLNEALALLVSKGFDVSDPTSDPQVSYPTPDDAPEPVWTDAQNSEEDC